MGSLLKPYVGNAILGDVAAIRANTLALAKWDVASLADLVSGVKTVAEGAQGYEFQLFNGSTWSRMEKWNIDAASVDGFSASKDPIPDVIAVRTSTGKLMGDILGNAATASSAKTLSEVLSLDLGGTGANTPAQARSNLGVPPTAHASDQPTYGLATAELYGHAKGSDSPDRTLTADTGTFLSPAGGWAMLDEYDEGVVHLEGNEQIRGAKTFLNSIAVLQVNPLLIVQASSVARWETPSSQVFQGVRFVDKNGEMSGDMRRFYNTNGMHYITMGVNRGDKNASLTATIHSDGTTYGTAPTTPANASGNQIVTADYLAGENSNVVHRTGNEELAGVKTFSNYLQYKNTSVHVGTWVSQANNRYLQYIDADGVAISGIQFRMTASANSVRFLARPPKDASSPLSDHTLLAAEQTEDGVKRAYCVIPSVASDGNDIATTSWVRDRLTISTEAPSGGTDGDFWFQY